MNVEFGCCIEDHLDNILDLLILLVEHMATAVVGSRFDKAW